MRRTLALSLVLTLSLGLLSGCGPDTQAQELTAQPVSVQPAGSPAVDQALTSFGLSLLQSAREAESGPVSSLPPPQPWRSPWRPTERTGIPWLSLKPFWGAASPWMS